MTMEDLLPHEKWVITVTLLEVPCIISPGEKEVAKKTWYVTVLITSKF